MKVSKDRSELIRVGMYFYGFVDKVDINQLTRFEKSAYKHCVNGDSSVIEKLSLGLLYFQARSIDIEPGG